MIRTRTSVGLEAISLALSPLSESQWLLHELGSDHHGRALVPDVRTWTEAPSQALSLLPRADLDRESETDLGWAWSLGPVTAALTISHCTSWNIEIS